MNRRLAPAGVEMNLCFRIRPARTGTGRSPGQVLPSHKGRHIYQGFLGRTRRLLLRVVVKEDAGAYHVVTAYKTSKVAKYWRAP